MFYALVPLIAFTTDFRAPELLLVLIILNAMFLHSLHHCDLSTDSGYTASVIC